MSPRFGEALFVAVGVFVYDAAFYDWQSGLVFGIGCGLLSYACGPWLTRQWERIQLRRQRRT